MKFDREIEKDTALYVDILESVRIGDARILHDSEGALLVQLINWPLYLLAAADVDEGISLIDSLTPGPEGDTVMVARGGPLVAYAKEQGFESSAPCVQVYYEKKEPIVFESELEIRHPDESEYERICNAYTLPISEEEILSCIARPEFSAGYLDGEMIGFIGMHSEGSLGMLHIFEEYRGRGYSEALVKHMVNGRIAEGAYPYGQIFCDNTASIALQKKLGFTFSNDYIYWMWKE